MASLTRWKIPQTRSGRRSISVSKLLKREAEGKLFKKHGSVADVPLVHLHDSIFKAAAYATHDHDYADNEFDTTGLPAQLRKRRLELPSREEVDVNPKPVVENHQDSQGSLTVGDLGTPGAFDGLGKISAAMQTLGELSRTWEVPSDDEVQTGAQQVERHQPFGLTLGEISAQTDTESVAGTKTSSGRPGVWAGFLSELGGLHAVTPDQLQKVAEVTREQAQQALQHLDTLESQKPTAGQLARGALVGSVVGPVASNVSKLISAGHLHTPREVAGQVAGGVIFGTATPLLKHKVETGTERRMLQDYVNSGQGGRLATQIESKLETP
jgi:hypothetical protein